MKALAEIYTIHTFAPISDLKISIKIIFFKFFANIEHSHFGGLKEHSLFLAKKIVQLVLGCIDADFCEALDDIYKLFARKYNFT